MTWLLILAFLLHVLVISAEYKVVCYYPNWSVYYEKSWTFGPTKIDPNLCTHILYAFAVLDKKSLELVPADSEVDFSSDRGYKSVVDLKKKNRNLKVMLSVGGWTDSNDDTGKYAKLVKSSKSRQNFIEKAKAFLKEHKFDGLDVDWEYPSDKGNFATLLKELKNAFKSDGLLLSAAVSADQGTIDSSYDVPALSNYLDMINVMTYDYSEGNSKTGENAPIDGVEKTIEYWLKKGADSRKLIVGIPFYGASFTLKKSNDNGIGAPVKGPGKAGQYTQEAGNLAYFEICTQSGWTIKRDPSQGIYAYKGDQWVGYDDPKTIETKMKYIKQKKLGGGMCWDLSQDDFRGQCCNVKYPLLNVMSNVLIGVGQSANSISCT